MLSKKILRSSIFVASLAVVGMLLVAGYQVWTALPGKGTEGSGVTGSEKARSDDVSHESPADMSQPLEVMVNGKKYPIDYVAVREDWLTISTSETPGKFPDMQIKISMTGQNISDFSNKKLSFSGQKFTDPHVQISVRGEKEFAINSEFINKDYRLQVEFGQEKDFRIPVRLYFVTSNKFNVSAVGAFQGKTSDLVLVDGKVDLNQDNSDTIWYAADQFVLDYFKGNNISKIKHSSISWSYPSNKDIHPDPDYIYSSANLYFSFEVDGEKRDAEFKMLRSNSGWFVYRVLKPESMRNAVKPDMKFDALAIFDVFGEQVVYQKFAKDKVKKWESKGSSLMYGSRPDKSKLRIGNADYLVELNDGRKRYLKVIAQKQGIWKITKILDGSQVPEAYGPLLDPGLARGADVQKQLAAKRIEKKLNAKYPDLQVRGVNFGCGYSQLLTDCKISWWRMVNNAEVCEGTRYMYRRQDAKSDWQFVRELAADEKLDHRDGSIKKRDKPEQHHCW